MAAKDSQVHVRTTLPRLPPSSARESVTTDRLLIRPLAADDLEAFHELRTQPEVMQWTSAGRIDADRGETAAKLEQFLPPHDATTFNCAVCLRGRDGAAGEGAATMIGVGGVHKVDRGWPELGYMIKREFWGKGLATEFVMAFLGMWDGLERRVVEMGVDAKTVVTEDDDDVVAGQSSGTNNVIAAKEVLLGVTDAKNLPSMRILENSGFEQYDEFAEESLYDPDKTLRLVGFRWFPQKARPN